MATSTADALEAAIADASKRYGVDAGTLRAFARIESGGNPLARTGSYSGVFQLGPEEFARYGGGNIYSIPDNTNAAAAKLADESDAFRRQNGRDPSGSELYMIHQQGAGGASAHMLNPDQPAWQSMLSTGEGQKKGEKWARAAIWGNVPDDMKQKFGSVDNVTSGAFTQMWSDKFDRASGGSSNAPIQTAAAGGEAAPMPTMADRPTQTDIAANIPPNIAANVANAAPTASAPPVASGGQSDPMNFLMSSLGLAPKNQDASSGDEMDQLRQKVAQLEQTRDQAGYGQQQGTAQKQGGIIAAPPATRMPDLTKIKSMIARNRGRLGLGSTGEA